MMTSAQVVETSLTTTDNNPSRDYTHPGQSNYTITSYPWIQTIYCSFIISFNKMVRNETTNVWFVTAAQGVNSTCYSLLN